MWLSNHRRRTAQSRGGLGLNFVEYLEQRSLLAVNIAVHHGDAANDGANLSETVLSPANVNATDFGKQFSMNVDAQVYAQPLYMQNVDITRGAVVGFHSVVYVATMHDTLYAIDANTGSVLWQDNFLNVINPTVPAASAGVTTLPTDYLERSNLGAEDGIIATPAIDVATSSLFLTASSQEIRGTDTHFVQRLWKVNLSDGSPVVPPAVIGDTISNNPFFAFTGYKYVAGPIVNGTGNNSKPLSYPNTDGWASAPGGAKTPVIAFNAIVQMQRTSETLANGNVYLGFASHGDEGPYYGWVLGYSESNLALTAAFVTTPTYEGIVGDSQTFTAQGGIWSSGSAIATDGTSLYLLTGNGVFNTSPTNFSSNGFPVDHNYADSLLKLNLDPASNASHQNGNGWGLAVADYFTPSNAKELNILDLDLGSGGVLVLPNSLTDGAGNPMLMFGGKESHVYLVDRNHLGKFNASYPETRNPDPRLYDRVLGEYVGDGINAGDNGVYSTPSYFNGRVYVGQAHGGALSFNVAMFASGTTPPGVIHTPTPLQSTSAFAYPDPTFTLSAHQNSAGVAWAMNTATSQLFAYDAANISTPIYNSNTVAADRYTGGMKFAVPTVANGMVYIATKGMVLGYGLRKSYLDSNANYFASPSNLSVTLSTDMTARLSWTTHSPFAGEFRVDRSQDGVNWKTLVYLQSSVVAYDDTIAAGKYDYRVVAVAGSNLTAASNVVAVSRPNDDQLSGLPIGTPGSYKNHGDTIAKTFDNNFATSFDAPNGSGNWVGLDLGTPHIITQIKYASRIGFSGRMDGGIFQASNSPSFSSGVTTLYTIGSNENPPSGMLSTATVEDAMPFRYVRYLAPANSFGNIAELQFFGTPSSANLTKLTGNLIGTSGSYKNRGDTIDKAVDGNLSSFFDGASADGNWVGLDLGTAKQIQQITYAPRASLPDRMVGGIFQASDSADFSSGVVALYTVKLLPTQNALTTVTINIAAKYRYVRYLSPHDSHGNVAEIAFYGS